MEDEFANINSQQIINTEEIDKLNDSLAKDDADSDEEVREGRESITVNRGSRKKHKTSAGRTPGREKLGRGKEKRKSIIGDDSHEEYFSSAMESDRLEDSASEAPDLSSDEEELRLDKRSGKTRGGAKLIKIFSPEDHPSLKLTNPYDAEAVIEFIDNYEIMAADYPDGDCSMVKCLSTEARNKMLAHGRTMRGNIQKACMSTLGLKALTENHVKKLLYDMNKAKSSADMIAKMKKITFMKDGSHFAVSSASMPAFYDQLILYNTRFIKLLKCYSLRASEEALPSLYKRNGVKGISDFYLEAIPDKAGKVFW